MKLRTLMMTVLGLAVISTACEKEDGVQGLPEINISEKAITIEEVSTSASVTTISVTASRDWTASSESEWIEVEPASGKASSEPQEVTVTLLPNNGFGRTGTVKFDIIYDSKTFTITQNGPLGWPEDAIIYYNDFDKEAATQTFGTGTSWPYLDQFEGWKNETGSGASNVEYSYSGISCRNNSNSDGSYSDYEGSGVNNLLFSSKPNFVVKNIALNGNKNLTLSFGTEKYAYGADDNTFKPEEFSVYVSKDNTKWVKLEYAFPDGFKSGRWDLASSTFSVPEGTENLSVYFASTLSGGHRMDDVKLTVSAEAGTAIDFSTGTDIDAGGGSSDNPGDGGNTNPSDAIYYNNFDKAEATKTYGSGSSYPYLDQFDGWKNETGSGASSVSYLFKAMSARNNSQSNSTYSTDNYKAVASGVNNLFFGTSAYFAVKDIDLGGKTNLTISFGTEKYDNNNKDAAFDPTELKVYVSADATKWVQIEYTFPNDYQVGKWDLASSTITVPSGTSKLSVYVTSTATSVHRIDDLKVVEASAAGTSIDFSTGVDLGLDGGSSDGGDSGNTNPGTGTTYSFKKVSAVTSGKSYLMVAAGNAAKPLASGKTYGYLSGDAVTVSNDVITMTSLDDAFVFTNTSDGYTILGSDNNYLIQTGTYNSFNVTAAPTEGQYWDVTVESDGTFKILNKNVSKYIQWSSQYSSYGSYASATGELPVLYELQGESSGDGGNTNPGDGGNTDPGSGSDTTPADAKTTKLVFSEAGIANSTEMTTYPIGDTGITLTFAKNEGSTPKYYTSGTAVRFYPKNSLTVSGKKIYKIVFTYNGTYTLAKATTTLSSGSYSDDTTTWVGETDSLTITNSATSGHARLVSLEIYYAE